jgi:hypothetical protein
MNAHSYCIKNCGKVDVILDKFSFEDPVGVGHIADLTTVGGPAAFRDADFTVTGIIIPPEDSICFTVEYIYIGGDDSCLSIGTKTGSIIVSSITGLTKSITTSITLEESGGDDAPMSACELRPNTATWRLTSQYGISVSPNTGVWNVGPPSMSVSPTTGTWNVGPGLNVVPTTGSWSVSP